MATQNPFNEGSPVKRRLAIFLVLVGIPAVVVGIPYGALRLACANGGCSSSDATSEPVGSVDVDVEGERDAADYGIGPLATITTDDYHATWVTLTVNGHAPIPMVPVLRVQIGDGGPVCATEDDGWWSHSDWDQATNVSHPTLYCDEHVPLGALEGVDAVSLR